MWEKAPYILKLSGATFFSWFKVSKMKKQPQKNQTTKKTPLRSPSTIPTGPTHTTPACSQWCRTNLTEWEQGFVCLKPLTYFYSHCRSQSLYCVIAELMLRACLFQNREESLGLKLLNNKLMNIMYSTKHALLSVTESMSPASNIRAKLSYIYFLFPQSCFCDPNSWMTDNTISCQEAFLLAVNVKATCCKKPQTAKHRAGVIPQRERIQTFKMYSQTAAALKVFHWLVWIPEAWPNAQLER